MKHMSRRYISHIRNRFFCKYQNFCLYPQTALMAVAQKKRNQTNAQAKLYREATLEMLKLE